MRDFFIINMKHEEVRKQLCMNAMSPNDALQFALVRERREMMYKRLNGGVPRMSKRNSSGAPERQWKQSARLHQKKISKRH